MPYPYRDLFVNINIIEWSGFMVNVNNMCIFEGRMVADAQCSTVGSGQNQFEKALFRIAVERSLSSEQRKKVRNGDKSIKTADFVPCSLIGGQVNTLRQYFPQGTPIKLIGRYTDYKTTDPQTGQDKYGHIFEVDHISFVVSNNSRGSQNNNSGNNNGGYQNSNNNYSAGNGGGQNNYQNNRNQNNQKVQQQAQPVNSNFSLFDDEEMPF